MKTLIVLCLAAGFAALSTLAKAQETMTSEKPGSMPASPSKPVGSLNKPSRAEEILKRFDKNGDGRLDDDEKADAHDAMLQEQMAKEAPPPAAQGLAYLQELAIELFDRNHDGRIDDNEQTDAMGFVEQGDPSATRETLFIRFDRNRDGKLDDFERRESEAYAMEHRGELMKEVLLKRFDANANGRLEPEEKTAIRAAFMTAPVRPMESPTISPPPASAPRPGK